MSTVKEELLPPAVSLPCMSCGKCIDNVSYEYFGGSAYFGPGIFLPPSHCDKSYHFKCKACGGGQAEFFHQDKQWLAIAATALGNMSMMHSWQWFAHDDLEHFIESHFSVLCPHKENNSKWKALFRSQMPRPFPFVARMKVKDVKYYALITHDGQQPEPEARQDMTPEKILHFQEDTQRYLVQWVGYDQRFSTFETIDTLEGCSDVLEDFKKFGPPEVENLEEILKRAESRASPEVKKRSKTSDKRESRARTEDQNQDDEEEEPSERKPSVVQEIVSPDDASADTNGVASPGPRTPTSSSKSRSKRPSSAESGSRDRKRAKDVSSESKSSKKIESEPKKPQSEPKKLELDPKKTDSEPEKQESEPKKQKKSKSKKVQPEPEKLDPKKSEPEVKKQELEVKKQGSNSGAMLQVVESNKSGHDSYFPDATDLFFYWWPHSSSGTKPSALPFGFLKSVSRSRTLKGTRYLLVEKTVLAPQEEVNFVYKNVRVRYAQEDALTLTDCAHKEDGDGLHFYMQPRD